MQVPAGVYPGQSFQMNFSGTLTLQLVNQGHNSVFVGVAIKLVNQGHNSVFVGVATPFSSALVSGQQMAITCPATATAGLVQLVCG